MQLRKLVRNLANYERICKLRNHHLPIQVDMDDFAKNTKFPKETYCEDCGIALELKLDRDDPNIYWVREI